MIYETEAVHRALASGRFDGLCATDVGAASRRRLVKALQARSTTVADRAVLLRHLLRYESEVQGGWERALVVPTGREWPTVEEWRQFGIRALPHVSGGVLVQADPWHPTWLPHVAASPETEAFREARRRSVEAAGGDPFLRTMGFRSYRSEGQKAAVRAVLTAPPRSTLLVNLPTSSGKSLCAHLLGLLPQEIGLSGNLTIVVVPTVALSLDQARVVEERLGHPAAYHSASTSEMAARNTEIRRRIREGTQRLVFTSPESLLGSLRSSVYAAARDGYLRALVIDEAHLVEQWGDEFRSAFQEVAGLRRALFRHNPRADFVTILLSATVPESGVDTLETLFGEPGPFAVCPAVQVRPEPSYWVRHCASREERDTRVIEALRYLPRPLILYTTRVEEAEAWAARLRAEGYGRLDLMTGNTSNEARDRIIRRWAEEELDLVVATSAFGLGIDQAHVRAVVHACVPETIDRFYQEVGRGGRDGLASLSLLLYTDADLETARNMSQPTLIGVELGRQRWERMFDEDNAEPLSGDRYRVRVDAPPALTPGRLDMQNALNTAWNLRTLTLMARAGLIALDDIPPSMGDPVPVSDVLPTRGRAAEHRVLELLSLDHQAPGCWERRVEPERRRTLDSQARGFRYLEEFLAEKRCAGRIFQDAYRVPLRREPNPRAEVAVAVSCGGCPDCRRKGKRPYTHQSAVPAYPWKRDGRVGSRLSSYTQAEPLLALFARMNMDVSEGAAQLEPLVRWSLNEGVRQIAASASFLEALQEQMAADLHRRPVFFASSYEAASALPVPTLLVLTPGRPFPKALMPPHPEGRVPYVAVIAEGEAAPGNPNRLLRDMLRSFTLDEFRRREAI